MADLMQAMQERHSVRRYTDREIEGPKAALLQKAAYEFREKSGLNIQLVTNEPGAFSSFMAKYGSFRNVRNYFAIAGKKGMEEAAGYFGEKLVLMAQTMGLNTCWVALTYSRKAVPVSLQPGESLIAVIALGYGETQGKPHRNRDMKDLYRCDGEMPDWFRRGLEAAMLAPTAVNQQKFRFTCRGDRVKAEALRGPLTKLDLGIVKYHFELGAGRENFQWMT